MDELATTIVLWGVTVLLLCWTWIPAFLSGLGGTRYSNGGSEDPNALSPLPSESDYLFWHNQLTALGYEPLGPAWMRITFNGPHWRYETAVRVLRSRTERGFAFVQKQPKPMDVWMLTIFATCWQGKGMLLTSNQVDEPPDEGEFVVQGMESIDLGAVHSLHLSQRDKMARTGRRIDPDLSIETLLNATKKYAGPTARHVGLRLGQTYLASHLMIHVLLSVPVVYATGPAHWAFPLVNLMLGAILASGEYFARLRAGRLMRKLIVADHGSDRA